MNAVIHAEVTITYVFFLFPSTHINTYTLRYICLYVHVYVHTHTDTIHAHRGYRKEDHSRPLNFLWVSHSCAPLTHHLVWQLLTADPRWALTVAAAAPSAHMQGWVLGNSEPRSSPRPGVNRTGGYLPQLPHPREALLLGGGVPHCFWVPCRISAHTGSETDHAIAYPDVASDLQIPVSC